MFSSEEQDCLDLQINIQAGEGGGEQSPVMELYVSTLAPEYPQMLPVVAITGGGLTPAQCRAVTKRLAIVASECRGEPMVFMLADAASEEITKLVSARAARREALKGEKRAQRSQDAIARLESAKESGGSASARKAELWASEEVEAIGETRPTLEEEGGAVPMGGNFGGAVKLDLGNEKPRARGKGGKRGKKR